MAFDGVPIGLSDGLAEHEGLFVVLGHVSGRPGHWPDRCGAGNRLQAGQLLAARPGVFPLPSHTVHRHPLSSISVRIIRHLSRSRALTQPIPTRYDCCCFHSLGGEEVVKGSHLPGSGPACGRAPRKRRERVRARFLSRGGDSGAGPQRVIKESQPTQRNTLGLARGSAPSNPGGGELPPPPITPGAFRGSSRPQRRGLRPLRERRCGCRSHAPPGRATGTFSVGNYIRDYYSLSFRPSRLWDGFPLQFPTQLLQFFGGFNQSALLGQLI